MSIHCADRVKDTTTTTGTGNITLADAPPTGYQSFDDAFSTDITFYYCIEGGAEWEVGQGHLSASTTLVRDIIFASTNSNAAVDFSSGTKNVFCTIPASSASRWNQKIRTTDTTITTNTTLTNDSVLQFPMAANGLYRFRLHVNFFMFADGDYKFALTGPALGTNRGIWTSYSTSGTAVSTIHTEGYLGSTSVTAITSVQGTVKSEGLLLCGGTGGTFAYQAAQVTSHANSSFTVTGSYIEWLRVL